MADDPTVVDQTQGADDQTPASQANTGGQVDDSNQVLPLDNQAPEEVEFNSLSGSSQDRIRELVRRARDAEERANNPYVAPQNFVAPPAPDSGVQDAVRKLSEVGIATKDDVNNTIDQKLNQIRWETEMNRLSSTYGGENGEPKFARDEVEDYIRNHPQYMGYSPEDVFKDKMFKDEFLNVELSKRETTPRSRSLRPNKQIAQQDSMTVEFIAERTDPAKHTDARQWQEEHKAEIDKVLSGMS